MAPPTVSLTERLATAAALRERWDFAGARAELADTLAELGTDPQPFPASLPDVFAGEPGPPAPTDTLAVLTARRMLAEVCHELGDRDDAYAIAAPLATECAWRLGEEHPATVKALATLAVITHARGELTAAERLYRRVLDGPASEDGPAGRAIRLSRAHLALLYADRGETARARTLLAGAYAAFRRAYGSADPDGLRLALRLADLYRRGGDRESARRVLSVAHAAGQSSTDPVRPLASAVERALAEVEPALPSPPASAPPGAVPPPTARHRLVRAARRSLAGRTGRESARRPPPWVPAVAIVSGLVLVAGLAVAGAAVLARAGKPAPAATAPAAAPLAVTLDDAGTTITVSWSELAADPAPIVVALAAGGRPPAVVATLPAGTRRYVLTSLDPALDYCVIVAAVPAGAAVSGATSVCTHRPGARRPTSTA